MEGGMRAVSYAKLSKDHELIARILGAGWANIS